MTTLLREVIGDVLRQARTGQGRTLREVSDGARVSLGYLSEVERGQKEASSELLNAICGALDVDLSEMLRLTSERVAAHESVTTLPVRAMAAPSRPMSRSSAAKRSGVAPAAPITPAR